MTRVYDKDREPAGPNPMILAQRRADRFEDPLDRARFMDAFAQGRIAEARGDERAYVWYRQALEEDDSVRVAGLIEGAASIPRQGNRKLGWR